MNRQCGACTLCCRLLPVVSLRKPASQRCVHQFSGGCAVYHRAGFPRECSIWSCRWLVDAETIGLRRPDRTGYVIDIMPDLIHARQRPEDEPAPVVCVQVWCDPARPEAWRDPALLRFMERKAATAGEVMLVRFGTTKAIVVIPPPLTANGEWLIIDSGIAKHSPTGSLLLDTVVSARRHRERNTA